MGNELNEALLFFIRESVNWHNYIVNSSASTGQYPIRLEFNIVGYLESATRDYFEHNPDGGFDSTRTRF